MAHIWTKQDGEPWEVVQLTGAACSIASGKSLREYKRRANITGARPSLVAFQDAAGHENWALLSSAGTDIRVNGAAMRLGLHVLRDRDAIQVKGRGAMFYSTERLAAVEPVPAMPEAMFCPRCKTALEAGTPGVKCPGCGTWHHQSEDLPCWIYAQQCALCDQQTDLDAGYRWTPEEL